MSRLAAIGLGLSLAGAVVAAPVDDYAVQWPIELADAAAGAHTVLLEDEVYRHARSPDLRDLDVLNADGQPVPAQLLRPADPDPAAGPRVAARWFTLPRDPAARGGWSMAVERDADGAVLRMQAQETAVAGDGPSAWLVDVSGIEGRVEALHLQWAGAGGIDRAYRLEASDDLRAWRLLQPQVQLVDLVRDGQRLLQQRVPVAARARYLRLLPEQGQGRPVLQSVQAELAAAGQGVPMHWHVLPGEISEDRGARSLRFALPGRWPVEAVDLEYAGNGTGQWRLYSRESAEAQWTLRAGPWVAYAMGAGTGTRRSTPQPLVAVTRDREWKLEGDGGIDTPPRLRVGWRPETMVFIAQGPGPYRLVAGSARATRAAAPVAQALAAIRAAEGSGWQPPVATLARMAPLAGDEALSPRPAPPDWRRWLLWALLASGAALVAWFAASLLRARAE